MTLEWYHIDVSDDVTVKHKFLEATILAWPNMDKNSSKVDILGLTTMVASQVASELNRFNSHG